MACSLGFYGDGISFQVVLSQSFWLRVLPGGAGLVQPRWISERRILGGGQTGGVSFWPFPNSSGWWWLISSVFLTRTSCHKTTHANGYYCQESVCSSVFVLSQRRFGVTLWCLARVGVFNQCASPNMTTWTAAHQPSLSFTISWSMPNFVFLFVLCLFLPTFTWNALESPELGRAKKVRPFGLTVSK